MCSVTQCYAMVVSARFIHEEDKFEKMKGSPLWFPPRRIADSTALLESRSCSSGRFTQDTLRRSCSRKSRLWWEDEIKVHPRDFKGRIVFMSMYNNIDWNQQNNEDICRHNSLRVSD